MRKTLMCNLDLQLTSIYRYDQHFLFASMPVTAVFSENFDRYLFYLEPAIHKYQPKLNQAQSIFLEATAHTMVILFSK